MKDVDLVLSELRVVVGMAPAIPCGLSGQDVRDTLLRTALLLAQLDAYASNGDLPTDWVR